MLRLSVPFSARYGFLTVMLMVLISISFSVGAQSQQVRGVVFFDRNGDGIRQADEPGLPDVKVSNGALVAVTDDNGHYELPVMDDMSVTVIQPSGWTVPLNEYSIPQFFYTHKLKGSSTPLRFGGLAPTGPLPESIDFALRPWGRGDAQFRCAVIGDSQTYSNDEIGYFRDSTIADLLALTLESPDCMIYLGDVVGDDLGLLERMMAVGGLVGVPQWFVFGNHDLDFDAKTPQDRADTWRAKVMPDYYAFEIGDVLFVALNNIVYPCGLDDAQLLGDDRCGQADRPSYNARVESRQVQWLSSLLAHTEPSKRVVLMHHAPLVSFVDADNRVHQTNNAGELHALLADRPALSLSGHTHSLENHDPGQFFKGWRANTGVGALPFRHIVAGAASGSWYQGDFDINGIPMALQRMGSPKGFLVLEFSGTDYIESYHGARLGPNRQQWVSLNTPQFRALHEALSQWMASEDARAPDAIPPYSVHDLDDRGIVTPRDLEQGVWLMVNVWLGTDSTEVVASINQGADMSLSRTQAGEGEPAFLGPAYADPFSTTRMMSVARSAIGSLVGDRRTQGFETFKGRTTMGPPRPQGRSLPDHNMHLWKMRLPDDLAMGIHHIEVRSTDRHGRVTTDHLVVEVVMDRPPRFWRSEVWVN
jgi:hypothetical protein